MKIVSKKPDRSIKKRVLRIPKPRIRLEMDYLKLAIIKAEYGLEADWEDLIYIYYTILNDRHLKSQIRTSIFKGLNQPFAVIDQTTKIIDRGCTELLNRIWFKKLRIVFHETEYWGYSLLELNEPVKSKSRIVDFEFNGFDLIPRELLLPPVGAIKIHSKNSEEGFVLLKYRNNPKYSRLIEIGDPESIGELAGLAEEVIIKSGARKDWSRASEKYGMPFLAIKTKTNDKNGVAILEGMAENVGSNGYIILDKKEDIELKTAESLDGGKIYSEQSKMCNHEMSKLINGNFNLSDEGRGAPIKYLMHTLNDFTRARMRREQYFINEQVFPILKKFGYPLNGKQYIFKAFLDEQIHPENY